MATRELAITKLLNLLEQFVGFQKDLVTKGYVYDKKVAHISNTVGCIYLPKNFIGKSFRVILIPKEDPYEQYEVATQGNATKLNKKMDKGLPVAIMNIVKEHPIKKIDTQAKEPGTEEAL